MSFSYIVRTDVEDFRIQRKDDIKVNQNTREMTKSGNKETAQQEGDASVGTV